jgi:hypothetical protein
MRMAGACAIGLIPDRRTVAIFDSPRRTSSSVHNDQGIIDRSYAWHFIAGLGLRMVLDELIQLACLPVDMPAWIMRISPS